MTKITATELARVADTLSADERLALIDHLWQGLSDADLPLTDAQITELRRREPHFETELAAVRPMDEVFRQLEDEA